MKILARLLLLSLLCLTPCQADARMDVSELFVDALLRSDAQEMDKVLAPNFWFIGPNGHIRDKEHFIRELDEKQLTVEHLDLSNTRETRVGETRLITANGHFQGSSIRPLPLGLMRFTMVIADNEGKEEIVLFQATPVIATPECTDGNCLIR